MLQTLLSWTVGGDETSWNAWTPTLNLVSPRLMYCLRRSASKVPGSASMDTSAPAVTPKRLSSALIRRSSCCGGMSEGVPPPKYMVLRGDSPTATLALISSMSRSTYSCNKHHDEVTA